MNLVQVPLYQGFNVRAVAADFHARFMAPIYNPGGLFSIGHSMLICSGIHYARRGRGKIRILGNYKKGQGIAGSKALILNKNVFRCISATHRHAAANTGAGGRAKRARSYRPDAAAGRWRTKWAEKGFARFAQRPGAARTEGKRKGCIRVRC